MGKHPIKIIRGVKAKGKFLKNVIEKVHKLVKELGKKVFLRSFKLVKKDTGIKKDWSLKRIKNFDKRVGLKYLVKQIRMMTAKNIWY